MRQRAHAVHLHLSESKAHIYFLQVFQGMKLINRSIFKLYISLNFEMDELSRQIGKLLSYLNIMLNLEISITFQINTNGFELRKFSEI